MKFWYITLKAILKPIYKLYYNPKIYNKENLNVEGPVIYAANHIHLMDQCNIIIHLWQKKNIGIHSKQDGSLKWLDAFQ